MLQAGGALRERSTAPEVLRSGGGRPLDATTRGETEARLGADPPDVSVHRDAAAHRSAREIGARQSFVPAAAGQLRVERTPRDGIGLGRGQPSRPVLLQLLQEPHPAAARRGPELAEVDIALVHGQLPLADLVLLVSVEAGFRVGGGLGGAPRVLVPDRAWATR
ncbi:DUF4157 domain-containing protein (plasmid) [Streptomyces sp. BHT-5-2]|nr:DUF4157 domain-containing protein [Streptomyces sp. BHT-5-2]